MIYIVLPDLEFENMSNLCRSMISAEIYSFSDFSKIKLEAPIIFNLSGKKLVRTCIEMDLNMLWEEPEFCKSLFENAKPLDNNNKISVIISTYKRQDLLQTAVFSILNQGYPNFEIVIVGDCCPTLDYTKFKDPRIRVENMVQNSNDGGCTPKNRGLELAKGNWISYLDDDNYYLRNHFLYFYERMCTTNAVYGFSSMIMGKYNIICKEPKLYRIDTSCVIHRKDLIEKYGNWKSHKEAGYSHDYEFVSRWSNEPYFATERCTMWYNLVGSYNNPKAIYEWYGDQ